MPVIGNILHCPVCDKPQSQINLTDCEFCGNDLGAPNVNIVSTEDEFNALHKRYNDSKEYCSINGTQDVLNLFEKSFNSNAKAIINVNLKTLDAWIVKSAAYQSYHRAVEEGKRTIANLDDDRKRTIIDSFLYGTYGRDICYATLTLNDVGLESYGNCRVILNDNSIKSRSSTLEENSYNFVATHKINLETPEIPLGYRSTWHEKLKLAVAKLHKKLSTANVEKDFIPMVLTNSGDRKNDDFIEVHIYKNLTTFAISSIFIPVPKKSTDILIVKAIEAKCPGIVTRY
jgi:hypothetical protein